MFSFNNKIEYSLINSFYRNASKKAPINPSRNTPRNAFRNAPVIYPRNAHMNALRNAPKNAPKNTHRKNFRNTHRKGPRNHTRNYLRNAKYTMYYKNYKDVERKKFCKAAEYHTLQ